MLRNSVIKYKPGEAVLELAVGDRIELGEERFERLSKAFLADIQAKFL